MIDLTLGSLVKVCMKGTVKAGQVDVGRLNERRLKGLPRGVDSWTTRLFQLFFLEDWGASLTFWAGESNHWQEQACYPYLLLLPTLLKSILGPGGADRPNFFSARSASSASFTISRLFFFMFLSWEAIWAITKCNKKQKLEKHQIMNTLAGHRRS